MTSACPTLDRLEQFLHQELPGAELETVETHISECPDCTKQLEEISRNEDVLHEMRGLLPTGARTHATAPLPEHIGHYRIVEQIGRGGMGAVYRAEQESPRRDVALKVIRPGVLSSRSLRRFEVEVEVLGRLQHAGIARILEAGTVGEGEDSQPFFAMELVDGKRLYEHIDTADLGLRARLELFLEICDAIQHAHEHGVIHRDLNPGNILVNTEGRAKVIDFGLARPTDNDSVSASAHTQFGHVLGTLPYASPEQVGGDPDSVDTRTDVFGLGAVLFHVLCSRPPLDLSASPLPESIRRISEELPPPPSSVRPMPADLDWITLKALEKDRDRRYSSAAELAADVRRFLTGEPVLAGPATLAYRASRFVKKYKPAVVLAALLLASLIGGLVVTTQQWFRAEAAETAKGLEATKAVLAAAAAEAAALEARREAETSRRLVEFVMGLFRANNRRENLGEIPTLSEVLDRGAEQALASLEEEPEIRVGMLITMASIFQTVRRYGDSIQLATEAREVAETVFGPAAPETLECLALLAQAYQITERTGEAEALWKLALQRDLEHNAPSELTATLHNNLGTLYVRQRRFDDAFLALRPALDLSLELVRADSAIALSIAYNLAQALELSRQPVEAEEIYQRTLVIWDSVHPGSPGSALVRGSYGINLYGRGEFARAEPLLRRGYEDCLKIYGAQHGLTVKFWGVWQASIEELKLAAGEDVDISGVVSPGAPAGAPTDTSNEAPAGTDVSGVDADASEGAIHPDAPESQADG